MISKIKGSVEWVDLTVKDAEQIKDFYSNVVGWDIKAESMGDYNDFSVLDENGKIVAGICNKRGDNKNLPSQWLMYVRVDCVSDSIKSCLAMSGKLLDGPRTLCGEQFCVIEDPAGAVLALMSTK